MLDDKGSADHEPLYYAANGEEDEGLSHSSIKVHLLGEECVTTKSHIFRPRFYEIRPVLPGDNLDKEVCCDKIFNVWYVLSLIMYKTVYCVEFAIVLFLVVVSYSYHN